MDTARTGTWWRSTSCLFRSPTRGGAPLPEEVGRDLFLGPSAMRRVKLTGRVALGLGALALLLWLRRAALSGAGRPAAREVRHGRALPCGAAARGRRRRSCQAGQREEGGIEGGGWSPGGLECRMLCSLLNYIEEDVAPFGERRRCKVVGPMGDLDFESPG